ncbi:MAG TPA: hypothetical protein DCZ75_11435 [Geobacter sp.]|nr:hypothetical protein [Geobacter sp.]
MWRENSIDLKLTRFYEMSARAALSLLIVVILLAIVAGIGCTFYDMRLIFRQDFHSAFKTIMVDMLTVLAIVEVLRTALAYFTEGRVKVTYIIDTVIVTVLTEVMAFWYKNIDWNEVAMTIALVLSLAFVRIIAVRFSPAGLRKEL